MHSCLLVCLKTDFLATALVNPQVGFRTGTSIPYPNSLLLSHPYIVCFLVDKRGMGNEGLRFERDLTEI